MRYIKARELKIGDSIRQTYKWYKVCDVTVGNSKVTVTVPYRESTAFIEFPADDEVLIKREVPEPEAEPLGAAWLPGINFEWQKFVPGVVARKVRAVFISDGGVRKRVSGWCRDTASATFELAETLGHEVTAETTKNTIPTQWSKRPVWSIKYSRCNNLHSAALMRDDEGVVHGPWGGTEAAAHAGLLALLGDRIQGL